MIDNKITFAYNKGYRVTSDGYVLNGDGAILKRRVTDTKGYFVFGIRYRGKKVMVGYHRLQAFQKYGFDMFKDGVMVRHLDGDNKNNNWDNIAIGTHSDNMQDIPKHIRISKATHAASFWKKHDGESVKKFYNDCKSYKKTMEEFGISSKGTLHYILTH